MSTRRQHNDGDSATPRRRWVIGEAWDTALLTTGSTVLVLVLIVALWRRGEQTLDGVDLVLSELHLGATYGTIARRGLWRTMPWDVIAMPLLIIAACYALEGASQGLWLTSIVVYAAVWHRGRQSMGVAAYYQRMVGGAASTMHRRLFNGAVYLPMLASIIFYTSQTPFSHGGERFLAHAAPAWFAWGITSVAALWLLVYFVTGARRVSRGEAHAGELWVILSHALAFGSAYVFGAWSAGYILVLAIHHEAQYLFFSYGIARSRTPEPPQGPRREVIFLLLFLAWPILGLTTAMLQLNANIDVLWPLWTGMLLCHYWWDSRVWTRRAFERSRSISS